MRLFAVLIDQIEHLDNSSILSYGVGQVYVTIEINQSSKQKLIDKSRFEWYFNTITPAYFMLRQYDAVHLILFDLFKFHFLALATVFLHIYANLRNQNCNPNVI